MNRHIHRQVTTRTGKPLSYLSLCYLGGQIYRVGVGERRGRGEEKKEEKRSWNILYMILI